MKPITALVIFLTSSFSGIAQTATIKQINQICPAPVALEPLRFLASDELMGRATTRPEINIAARYISEQFRSIGVQEVPGTADYFQPFDVKIQVPPNTGFFSMGTLKYAIGQEMVQSRGGDVSLDAQVVYAGYGAKTDFDKLDVKGKIVVCELGINDSTTVNDGLRLVPMKQKLAAARGAVALVERFKDAVSWPAYSKYMMGEHAPREDSTGLPVFIINDGNAGMPTMLQNQTNGSIVVSGNQIKAVPAKNVMGYIEGTDATLKSQYIVLSAHYDHLGVAKQPKMEEGKMDSIYNGARDNAIGTTAVIDAARFFAQHPPKRSVLFIAYTGEEMGELGSKYFSAHPAIPLRQLVYNLNIDNASYNDTTIVTVVGLGRTSADEDIKKGCAAFGLTALPDPVPEQNLFDRSDNVNLAVKGIPSPTFSLGIRKFDETITNRYHQLSDEVGNFNLSYAMKYMDAFILAAKYIADNPAQPAWIKGDKYEAAWKTLYQ